MGFTSSSRTEEPQWSRDQDGFEVRSVVINGHERAYVQLGRDLGTAPVLLLLHGLACDHTTWAPVLESLARRYTVIAPDLLGHGASAKPRADYSVGGYANGMRDLLTVLGVERVTVVGHSLGGGVAMQFAYQYPERTERLALISPGGFGPEVTPAIRAITTPGFQQVMGLLTLPGVRHLGVAWLRALAASRLPFVRDLDEVASIYESFADPRTLAATRHVVRAVVDWKGQIITMTDRAYLTEHMPMCVIWGRDDMVIPVRHASIAAAIAPSARVEVVPNAGHFPHKDHPERVVKILNDFVKSTSPATHDDSVWRAHLASGGNPDLRRAQAGEAPVAALRRLPSA
ncbi:MAG: alpha/beta fold hydrolase [Nocardioides sp.]